MVFLLRLGMAALIHKYFLLQKPAATIAVVKRCMYIKQTAKTSQVSV